MCHKMGKKAKKELNDSYKHFGFKLPEPKTYHERLMHCHDREFQLGRYYKPLTRNMERVYRKCVDRYFPKSLFDMLRPLPSILANK